MLGKARKIWNGFLTILVVFTVFVSAALVLVRVADIHPYIVLSGSMEPMYPTGSLIYVKETDANELEEGNVITFLLEKDLVVTHRIVEVKKVDGSDMTWYRTKGDANQTEDGQLVSSQNVIGVPVFSVPKAGYVIEAMRNPPVREILFAIGGIIFLITLFFDVTKQGRGLWAPK